MGGRVHSNHLVTTGNSKDVTSWRAKPSACHGLRHYWIAEGKGLEPISLAVCKKITREEPAQEEHDGDVNDQLQNTVADDVPSLRFQYAEKWKHPERINQVGKGF
jgi:hypothetical protein